MRACLKAYPKEPSSQKQLFMASCIYRKAYSSRTRSMRRFIRLLNLWRLLFDELTLWYRRKSSQLLLRLHLTLLRHRLLHQTPLSGHQMRLLKTFPKLQWMRPQLRLLLPSQLLPPRLVRLLPSIRLMLAQLLETHRMYQAMMLSLAMLRS